MPTVLESVRPTVDRTIRSLAAAKFAADPIAGPHLSRVTSIVSSAYKRHGAILEVALFKAIESSNVIEAYSRVPFFITRNASGYVENHDIKTPEGLRACLATSIPYKEDAAARYELDILYFDHSTESVVALEVKRGNGDFDRGKRDSMIKAALTVRTLLASYAETRGWSPRHVESRILAYYGVPKFPRPIYLRGQDLDAFIAPGIIESVEEVNGYFRARLMELVEPEMRQETLI
ncbi:MAG: hypothetical protein ACQEUZ_09930 [Pseudomonadota bacterium]